MNLVSTSHIYISSCCICHICPLGTFGINAFTSVYFAFKALLTFVKRWHHLKFFSQMFKRQQFIEAINETCANFYEISILTDCKFGHKTLHNEFWSSDIIKIFCCGCRNEVESFFYTEGIALLVNKLFCVMFSWRLCPSVNCQNKCGP